MTTPNHRVIVEKAIIQMNDLLQIIIGIWKRRTAIRIWSLGCQRANGETGRIEIIEPVLFFIEGLTQNGRHLMDIFEVLATAKAKKASDLHLSAGSPPLVRVNGELMQMTEFALPTP